jgi:Family of unknown function (DUF5678)
MIQDKGDCGMPELVEKKEQLEKLKNFKSDVDWFQDNYESLKDQYKGQYVAIKNKTLLDHDNDADKLLERLSENYGDISSFVVEHIDENKYVYVM